MTKLSRWVGILQVKSKSFRDATPRFYDFNDPFVVRFEVEPLVWLEREQTIPIHEDFIWPNLLLTKNYEKSGKWTGKFRRSLTAIDKSDGEFLENVLREQGEKQRVYAIDINEYRKLLTKRVKRSDREVNVTVPTEETEAIVEEIPEIRKSVQIQGILARIGEEMGFSIWLPRSDRNLVAHEWKADPMSLLDQLPLNYDEATLRTIEQIDVIWLKRRSIIRAFEI
ncbi:MAG: hypothetical protein ACRDFQ_03730 [Anaerolineales bacterium]